MKKLWKIHWFIDYCLVKLTDSEDQLFNMYYWFGCCFLDGKNAYSSKRRLRADMISSPQGDLKHTGHVGLDGAYFGDVSFLGDKVNQFQFNKNVFYNNNK